MTTVREGIRLLVFCVQQELREDARERVRQDGHQIRAEVPRKLSFLPHINYISRLRRLVAILVLSLLNNPFSLMWRWSKPTCTSNWVVLAHNMAPQYQDAPVCVCKGNLASRLFQVSILDRQWRIAVGPLKEEGPTNQANTQTTTCPPPPPFPQPHAQMSREVPSGLAGGPGSRCLWGWRGSGKTNMLHLTRVM